MLVHACHVCSEATFENARFCQSCGAPLDAVVMMLNDDAASLGERRRTASWRGQLLVPLGVVAGLGVLAVVVFFGDRGQSGVDTETVEAPGAAFSESTLDQSVPVATTPPTSTRREPAPAVDPAILPDMAATHVVVGARRNLQFLDLETGLWTRTDIPSDIYEMAAVNQGVVFSQPSGDIAYASTNGADVMAIAANDHSTLLGAIDGLVVLGTHDAGPRGERVEARRLDGTVAWTAALPAGAGAHGLTTDGLVIIQANEQVVLLDPSTMDFTAIATGSIVGSVGDLILVESCDAQLHCGTDQISASSGDRHRVIEERGWFQTLGQDSLRFHSGLTRETINFKVIDGTITVADAPLPLDGALPTGAAIDATGVAVDVSGHELRFLQDGQLLLALPAPLDGCCRDAIVVLIANG